MRPPPPGIDPGERGDRLRLRPSHISWLVAAPIAAMLVWIIVTTPVGTSGRPDLTVSPGATFYVLGSDAEGLRVGQRAPSFGDDLLLDLEGRPVELERYRGQPLWIVFWATWCPPCQQETPDLRAAYEAYRDDGLALLAISVEEPAGEVRDYATRFALRYDIAIDATGSASRAYGVFGLPTHYFVGRDGVIRERYLGPLDRKRMNERIELITGP